jgi:hypothetical protein
MAGPLERRSPYPPSTSHSPCPRDHMRRARARPFYAKGLVVQVGALTSRCASALALMSRPTLAWPLCRTLAQRPGRPAAHAHHVEAFPLKALCLTGFLTLLLARFRKSRTSIQRTSPSEFRITSSTENAFSTQQRAWCSRRAYRVKDKS